MAESWNYASSTILVPELLVPWEKVGAPEEVGILLQRAERCYLLGNFEEAITIYFEAEHLWKTAMFGFCFM